MGQAMIFALTLLAVSAAAADPAAFAVVEKPGGQVSFYTSEGKRVGGVAVGQYPHEIVRSPDGRHAYVSDNGILWMTNPGQGGNTISIIDLEKRTKVGAISLGAYRRPHGMDLDPKTNRMVVTIENPHGLLLIDLAGRKVLRKYDTGGAAPHMVLLSPDRQYAYVSNTGSNTIGIVHLESGKVKTIATGGRPQGGALSPDGALAYITNSDGNSISILDTRSQQIVGTIATGKGPGRIAVTPDGRTLVYNLQAGQAVGFADAATRKQTAVVPIGGDPLSLTMSRDGAFAYAGIQDQDKVVIVSVKDRKVTRTFQTPKGAGPDPVLPLN
jgi:YVTN family beta-propeller protein